VIFFSLGLPGRLAEWCDAVLACLATRLGGKVTVISWPPLANMFGYQEIAPVLDQLALSLIGTDATHLVIGARQPDERLRAALVATKSRFVVALDDPRFAVDDILRSTDGDLKTVTRAIANSCPLVMRCASAPGAITIRGYRSGTGAAAAVSALAHHFEFALDDNEVQNIVDELTARGLCYGPGSREEEANQNAVQRHKMIEGALGGYAECFAGGDLTQLIWPRELFIVNGGSNSGPVDALDLCGGTRILIYGPYIHLPSGSWLARVVLGFSTEAAGHTFLVDAYSGGQLPLAYRSIQPMKGGVYSVDIDFSLDEPSGLGLEIRVVISSDSAQGQLAFGHVALRPLAMRQPDAVIGSQEDFRTVLDL
jgi:hypothetical protein